jgi:hypothetical protein
VYRFIDGEQALSQTPSEIESRTAMNADRLQTAVWLMTPLIGFLLLVTVVAARTGTLIIPVIVAMVLMMLIVAGLLRHGMDATTT